MLLNDRDTVDVKIGATTWRVGLVPWVWLSEQIARLNEAERPMHAQRRRVTAAVGEQASDESRGEWAAGDPEFLAAAAKSRALRSVVEAEIVRVGVRGVEGNRAPVVFATDVVAGRERTVVSAETLDLMHRHPGLVSELAGAVMAANTPSDDEAAGF